MGYDEFHLSLERAQTKTNSENNIKRILSVIGAIGVVWGMTFTYLNYTKDEKIDSLETQIENLTHINDSLISQKDTTN
jgi:hypothetical protein